MLRGNFFTILFKHYSFDGDDTRAFEALKKFLLTGGDLGEGAGAAAAGLSLEGGAARLLPPGAGGSSRCSCRGAGALQSAAKISGETWVALDSERGAGPLRTTSAKLPFDKKENRFLASGTPVYEKRGPKWCIASPGGPRRVQTYPGLGSTTRMPFSPDTGKPRTVRRGRANPHGSGSVETPLSKHLLSQVPPAGKTPVYEKRGPKWCVASPGGPRRVQTYPSLGSTTRMPFSPDTGKPRTAIRGRASPHGSGSVEAPLSKHLLSQVPPAGFNAEGRADAYTITP
ncbi:hypothetical protein ISCGN_028396 [Ixodes scapularis]